MPVVQKLGTVLHLLSEITQGKTACGHDSSRFYVTTNEEEATCRRCLTNRASTTDPRVRWMQSGGRCPVCLDFNSEWRSNHSTEFRINMIAKIRKHKTESGHPVRAGTTYWSALFDAREWRLEHEDTGSKSLLLDGGLATLIDSSAHKWVSQYKWKAYQSRGGRNYVYFGRLALHSLILGKLAGKQIDHINNDPLDNRLCNLRHCTTEENHRNTRATPGKFKGVSFDTARGTWSMWISLGPRGAQKQVHRSGFKTAVEAALEYDLFARKWFGEFARVNFPNRC